MNLEEKQLSKKYFYKGKIVNMRVDNAVLPNGKTALREVVEHPGGVGVVALTQNNEVLAVRQFRYPYGEVLLEIPAGKLDSCNELPIEAVKRELKEETGAEAENIIPLGVVYPSPGCYGENLYLFAAKNLRFGNNNLDEDEFLEVEKIPLDRFVEMVMNGEIKDAKTEIGILKAEKLVKEGKL